MNEVPVDPGVVGLLAEMLPSTPVSAADVPVEDHREGARAAYAFYARDADPIDVHQVTDEAVFADDGSVPVRVYRPEEPSAVIAFMHGGAWMTGGLDESDHAMRRLSRDTGAVVVSIDYRMVPEHPFPAPLNDSYDAVRWAADLRPDLPLLVAGDSAGGTLAACVCLRARDEDGPRIDAQVLVYPGIDDDLDTPSMLAFGADVPNSREDLRFLIGQYASHGSALGSPYALPGRAESLAGLPRAVMVIAGHDRLRSAEEAYADRLTRHGVPVTVQLDLELTHAWFDFAPRVPAADRAFTRLTDTISELISEIADMR